jgi:hypothetical protein
LIAYVIKNKINLSSVTVHELINGNYIENINISKSRIINDLKRRYLSKLIIIKTINKIELIDIVNKNNFDSVYLLNTVREKINDIKNRLQIAYRYSVNSLKNEEISDFQITKYGKSIKDYLEPILTYVIKKNALTARDLYPQNDNDFEHTYTIFKKIKSITKKSNKSNINSFWGLSYETNTEYINQNKKFNLIKLKENKIDNKNNYIYDL